MTTTALPGAEEVPGEGDRRQRVLGGRLQRLLHGWLLVYTFLWLAEGVLRKWLLPGLGDPLYFGRDLLTLGVLATALVTGVPRPAVAAMTRPLWWIGGLGVLLSVQVVVGSYPLRPAAVGLSTYAAPAVAVLMTFAIQDRARAFVQVSRLVLLFLPIQAVLTAMQVTSPATSVWNRVGDESSAALFTADDVVRASGTFVSPSALSSYVALVIALVAARALGRRRLLSPLVALQLASCVLIVFLGGSRGALLSAAVVGAGALLWTLRGAGSALSRLVRFVAVAGVVYVLAELTQRLFATVVDAFATRIDQAAQAEDTAARILDSTFGYLDSVGQISLLGDGLGSHTLAGIAAGSPQLWIEGEYPRWVAEAGLTGLFACVVRQLVTVALVLAAYRASRRASDPTAFLLGLSLFPALMYGAITAPASSAGFAVVALGLLRLVWNGSGVQPEPPPRDHGGWHSSRSAGQTTKPAGRTT